MPKDDLRPIVYVAGPISKGSMHHNIRRALDMARKLWNKGYLPFVPQLSFFWHIIYPIDDGEGYVKADGSLNFWMDYDFQMIRNCQALFRLDGESVGADMEIEFAHKLGIPVWTYLADVPDAGALARKDETKDDLWAIADAMRAQYGNGMRGVDVLRSMISEFEQEHDFAHDPTPEGTRGYIDICLNVLEGAEIALNRPGVKAIVRSNSN